MKEQCITNDVANLAYSKGFINNNPITQSLLQKWLRDEHQINIIVAFFPNSKKFSGNAYSMLLNGKEYMEELRKDKLLKCDTYEEALEMGLLIGLDILKSKKYGAFQ